MTVGFNALCFYVKFQCGDTPEGRKNFDDWLKTKEEEIRKKQRKER